jgi:hypothetical protein
VTRAQERRGSPAEGRRRGRDLLDEGVGIALAALLRLVALPGSQLNDVGAVEVLSVTGAASHGLRNTIVIIVLGRPASDVLGRKTEPEHFGSDKPLGLPRRVPAKSAGRLTPVRGGYTARSLRIAPRVALLSNRDDTLRNPLGSRDMKGFPNQVADLPKLAAGMRCIAELLDNGADASDDGVFGEALVRSGVIRTGHTPIPIDRYLREQLAKSKDRQSFRATARGLLELYRALGLIRPAGDRIVATSDGVMAAAFGGAPLDDSQIEFWRRVVRNLRHFGGDATASHPYQMMLHLIGQRPGISRAKCALALEARDDSPEELARIVALSDLSEEQIRDRIGVTKSNWDNAKKVLPRFAEQLRDVVNFGDGYRLADSPGEADATPPGQDSRERAPDTPRRPRRSRSVTPTTIGNAGLAERDEPEEQPIIDPAARAAAARLRFDRLRRHNLLVRALAERLQSVGMALYEDPFDILAVLGRVGILCEIKTLDGTETDERDRVRDALGQLLYYEAFVASPVAGGAAIHKVACFENAPTEEHQRWLNQSGIATIWSVNGRFRGDAVAAGMLGGYLEELG